MNWEAANFFWVVILGLVAVIVFFVRREIVNSKREAEQELKIQKLQEAVSKMEDSQGKCHQLNECSVRFASQEKDIGEALRKIHNQTAYSLSVEKKVERMDVQLSHVSTQMSNMVTMMTEVRDIVIKIEGANEEKERQDAKKE